MADAKSVIQDMKRQIESLDRRAGYTDEALVAHDHLFDRISDVVATRLDNLEGAVFTLVSMQIDQLSSLFSVAETDEQRAAMSQSMGNLTGVQSVIAPHLFARVYRIHPLTGEELDDAGLEAFLAEDRVVQLYDDAHPDAGADTDGGAQTTQGKE